MEKKVESRDQSGGITAENININHHYTTIKKESKKKGPVKTIVTIIFVLAAIATILGYVTGSFSKKPSPFVTNKRTAIQPIKY